MRILTLGTAAAALVAGITPALAQDDTASGRRPFTGARVEMLGGYESARQTDPANLGHRNRKGGFVGGVGIGGDFQAGPVVLGVEGEASQASTRTRYYNTAGAGSVYTVDQGRDLYAGGRIGLVAGRTMFYGKGGYTNMRMNEHMDQPSLAQVDAHQNLNGWRAGAGIEHMMGRNGYAKVEYRYSHYERDAALGYHPQKHQVVAGVGVRF